MGAIEIKHRLSEDPNEEALLETGMLFVTLMHGVLKAPEERQLPAAYIEAKGRERVPGWALYYDVAGLTKPVFKQEVQPPGATDFEDPNYEGFGYMGGFGILMYPTAITMTKEGGDEPVLSSEWKRVAELSESLRGYLPIIRDMLKDWHPTLLPSVYFDACVGMDGYAPDWLHIGSRWEREGGLEPWERFDRMYGHLGVRLRDMLTLRYRRFHAWHTDRLFGCFARQVAVEVIGDEALGQMDEGNLVLTEEQESEIEEKGLELIGEFIGEIFGMGLDEFSRDYAAARDWLEEKSDEVFINFAHRLGLWPLIKKQVFEEIWGKDVVELADFPPGAVVLQPQGDVRGARMMVVTYPPALGVIEESGMEPSLGSR